MVKTTHNSQQCCSWNQDLVDAAAQDEDVDMKEAVSGSHPNEDQEQGSLPDQGHQPNLQVQGPERQQNSRPKTAREARDNVQPPDTHANMNQMQGAVHTRSSKGWSATASTKDWISA